MIALHTTIHFRQLYKLGRFTLRFVPKLSKTMSKNYKPLSMPNNPLTVKPYYTSK